MMVDCGEGAQLSMRRMGLKFSRLNHVFLSHLHGDHCLGLPGLLSTLALQQKGGTVTVHTFAEGAELLGMNERKSRQLRGRELISVCVFLGVDPREFANKETDKVLV